MEDKILKAAKKQFFDYEGSLFMMAREEVLEKYLNYHIPKDIEIEWINEMFDNRYKKLDVNNAESLIFMTSIISKHADSLFNKLYLVDQCITKNINKCLDIERVQILVESTLYTLHTIDRIDVKKEIASFEKLKRKVRIRKIKLMIWNCMNPSRRICYPPNSASVDVSSAKDKNTQSTNLIGRVKE